MSDTREILESSHVGRRVSGPMALLATGLGAGLLAWGAAAQVGSGSPGAGGRPPAASAASGPAAAGRAWVSLAPACVDGPPPDARATCERQLREALVLLSGPSARTDCHLTADTAQHWMRVTGHLPGACGSATAEERRPRPRCSSASWPS